MSAGGFTPYPAIDVRGGRVVRLAQGDYGRETHYGDDPLDLAVRYAEEGARWLHLVDLDARQDGSGAWRLPVHGWTEDAAATLEPLARRYAQAGLRHLLCTDIARDGMLAGPNLALYRTLAAIAPGLQVQASGGVRGAGDVAAVREAARRVRSAVGGRGWRMLSRRIIPCLDVRDGRVVKGVRFRDHVDMGDIVELALRYRDEGADELVFYDISASPQGRSVDVHWVERVSSCLDIPFCVAGGIRDVETARRVLHAGADKVSVNTPALERPELVSELAAEFGVQCVVVGIDSVREPDGRWRVRSHTGNPDAMRAPGRGTLDWVAEVQRLGAGEIVLNCMDSDGVRRGYDIEQLKAVRAVCDVPLVASGGAGGVAHFAEVFREADADAALAASVFHSGAVRIPELKRELRAQGIEVRT
jgi:cyclase